jgi:hypothetical protein
MIRINMERRRLLITGCGRSGTLYAMEIWRALGLDIRHERPVPPNGMIGADGMASWFMAADDPEPPSGPSALDYEFDVIIHQVRHPLKVIASMAQFILREGKRAPGYIEQNVPDTKLSSDEQNYLDHKHQLILQGSRYWYHWNVLAEAKADATVKIENLNLQLPYLCDLVGIDYQPGVLRGIPEDINARHLHIQDEPWVVDWTEIKNLDTRLYENIRDLAATYGYEE